jgi:hypothetical protein
MEELLDEKIREAEQCEDLDVSEEYLTGYINGLNMAKQIHREITQALFTYNVGFKDSFDRDQETQLDAHSIKELGELIDSLTAEMDIQKVTYIEITVEED